MIDAVVTKALPPGTSAEWLVHKFGPNVDATIRLGVRDSEYDFDLPTATEAG